MGLLSHKNWDKFEPKDLNLFTTTLTTPTALLIIPAACICHTYTKKAFKLDSTVLPKF